MILSTVTTKGTKGYDDPDDAQVVSAIEDVYAERIDAVILVADRKRNLFMQLGHGGWHIEHCVGPKGPIFAADEVPIELATAMFRSYLSGDDSWRDAVNWGVEIERL